MEFLSLFPILVSVYGQQIGNQGNHNFGIASTFFFSINLIFIIFNYLLLKKKDINNFKNTKYPHQEK